jgi:dihydrofolate reductase
MSCAAISCQTVSHNCPFPAVRSQLLRSVFVRKLKSEPGGNIVTDGSSQLVHAVLESDLVDELHLHIYPLTLGRGKRVMPEGLHAGFRLTSTTPYPIGVVGLHYERADRAIG